RGVGKNDTVAIIAPNTPPMYEAAFGDPMCGGVLNTLNTRLDAEAIAFQLRHGGAKVLITDRELSATIEQALALLDDKPLVSNILNWGMPHHAVYLWTLPMFHCNGWCFPWTIAERAGVNVCLRRVEAKAMLDAIREHHVTHMCGAPIVYGMLINAPADMRAGI